MREEKSKEIYQIVALSFILMLALALALYVLFDSIGLIKVVI